MLKRLLWLTLWLLFALKWSATNAADEREHVHIKLHMPNVIRKHTHYQKVQKHNHQRPIHHPYKHHLPPAPPSSPSPHAKKVPYSPMQLDFYAAEQIAPYHSAPILHEANLAPNYGPVLFDNDITIPPTMQSMRIQAPPATTQMSMNKQLVQHIFSPEIMSALAGGDTNTLVADDFLAELQREYNSNYATLRARPERLTQAKVHKRKKYGGSTDMWDSYLATTLQTKPQPQRHQQNTQRQQLQHYPTTNQVYRNNNNYYYNQHQQQHYKNNNKFASTGDEYDESTDDDTEDDDDDNDNYKDNHNDNDEDDGASDSEDSAEFAVGNTAHHGADDFEEDMKDFRGFYPVSYQDMYGAFAVPKESLPTSPTRLKWWQHQRQRDQQQQREQQQFAMPSVRVSSAAMHGMSSTAATSPLTTDFQQLRLHQPLQQEPQQHHQRRKQRKNRIKTKRTRVQ